jgi:hypothetical protein
MTGLEQVSRSQLLLQYLLAVDMTVGKNAIVEHSPNTSQRLAAPLEIPNA